jgi:hypothetical protein
VTLLRLSCPTKGNALDDATVAGIVETVLVQIACASKDILLPMSNRKRQI